MRHPAILDHEGCAMTRLRLATVLATVTLACTLGGCDFPDPAGDRTPTTGASTLDTSPSAAAVALTCSDVGNASVYAPVHPYNLNGEAGLHFIDGLWSGPGGRSVAVQAPCAVGELVPGAGPSAVVALMSMTAGTTGRYWSLAICRVQSGDVFCSVVTHFDDREPVESITIGGGDVTVVYLTRTPDVAGVGLDIRRTAIYRVGGDALHEVSHTDVSL
jgi:hypothetical protein